MQLGSVVGYSLSGIGKQDKEVETKFGRKFGAMMDSSG